MNMQTKSEIKQKITGVLLDTWEALYILLPHKKVRGNAFASDYMYSDAETIAS